MRNIRKYIILLFGLTLMGCENVRAKDDFNLINNGMTTGKVVEILGKPYEKNTDLTVINDDLSRIENILKEYFQTYDDAFIAELEGTPSNSIEIKNYERFKRNYSDIKIVKSYIDKRENLERYTYVYDNVNSDDLNSLYDIVFYDDEVIYHLDN